MKKIYNKIFTRNFFIISALFFIIAACDLAITSIECPDTVTANEEATFKMFIKADSNADLNGDKLIISVLMPISWNAKNSKVTYTSTLDDGAQKMSLVPENVSPVKHPGKSWAEVLKGGLGVGPNVLNDMEWVTFQSDKSYNVTNGLNFTAVVTIKTLIGPKKLRAKIGFFVNDTDNGYDASDGRRWKVVYSDCVDVLGGEGVLIDFCQLHYNAAQPLSATKNDFLTFKFQGDISDNPLNAANEVHFCATAHTTNGKSYEVCGFDAKTKMKNGSQFGHTYGITIWPAQYFNIPENEELSYIEYSFTNEDGSAKIVEDDGSLYIYNFECK